MKYELALPIAQDIARTLQPFCEVVKIAGSIRREKDEVKDIEIVCLPKKILIPEKKEGLFNDIVIPEKTVIEPMFIELCNRLGIIIKGKPTGKMMQIGLHQKINLDLFMPDSFDFYRQFAIRTGSADFSHKVIAAGWRKIGWVGSDQGLRKMSDCVEKITPSGHSWICKNENTEPPPVWRSEREFFDWIKVKYVHPKDRNI